MENKLDKLFRDKLEHHAMEPSEQAWKKVAAGFSKKNPLTSNEGIERSMVIVWRVAAAVALIGVITILIISPWKGEGTSTLANENTESTQKKIEKITTSEIKNENVSKEKTEVSAKVESDKLAKPNKTINPTNKTTTPKLYNRPVEQPVAESNQETMKLDNEAVAANTIEPIQTEVQTLPALNEKAATEKTLVIVYTLAPVEGKPASEPIKSKPLQRMLAFAKDVKSGETTLASVRNMKDDFFGTAETSH